MDITDQETREKLLKDMAAAGDTNELPEYLALKNLNTLRDHGVSSQPILMMFQGEIVKGFAQGIAGKEIKSVKFVMSKPEFKLYERMFMQSRDSV